MEKEKVMKIKICKVKNYKWNDNGNGYIKTESTNKPTYLHRLLLNCPKGLEVDHIDHNKLNNRKSN